jgi:acetyl-CoA acyltransferase
LTPNLDVFARDENRHRVRNGPDREKVAERWRVSREDQDAFALSSHVKALAAQASGEFAAEISPYPLHENVPDLASGKSSPRIAR